MATYKTITDPLALTIWTQGGTTTQTFATGINDAGDVVGYYYAENGVVAGYIDVGGALTTISDPNATNQTFVQGVNDTGEVVGFYNNAVAFPGYYEGFAKIGNVYTTIDDPNSTEGTYAYGVNKYGTIVGTYSNASGEYGFADVKGVYSTIAVAGASSTWVYGLNDKGERVGGYTFTDAEGVVEEAAFLDDNGKMKEIGARLLADGATNVVATGINDKGEIVGYFVDQGLDQGFVDIAGKIATVNDPHGNDGSQLFGVNASGEAVGTYARLGTDSPIQSCGRQPRLHLELSSLDRRLADQAPPAPAGCAAAGCKSRRRDGEPAG